MIIGAVRRIRSDSVIMFALCSRVGPHVSRSRTGAVLLEAIAALAILAVAGIAALTMAREAASSAVRARRTDDEFRRAGAFFDAVSLWPRADLDQRLGTRAQGPWMLTLDRPAPAIYSAILQDSASGAILLRTFLYRPIAAEGPQGAGLDR